MTLDEFELALRQGHGRAVLHVEQQGPRGLRRAILYACLHDLRYDWQCEDRRGLYLFDLLHATGEPERYTPRICIALANGADDNKNTGQWVELCYYLARHGDPAARNALYTRFTRKRKAGWHWGAKEIVCLDGLAGYAVVAEHLAHYPFDEEDRWAETSLLNDLEEQMGREGMIRGVNALARSRPHIADYLYGTLQDWEAKQRESEEWYAKTEPLPDLATIRQMIQAPGRVFISGIYRWRQELDDESFKTLAGDFAQATDETTILRFLRLFQRRPYPFAPDPLLALVREGSDKIAWRAAQALALVSHPGIRQLALEIAAETSREQHRLVHAIPLLQANAEPSDAALIARIALLRWDDDTGHTLAIAISEYDEANPAIDLTGTLHHLYHAVPCSVCRCRMVRILQERNRLTPEMVRECRYDADDGIRRLAAPKMA